MWLTNAALVVILVLMTMTLGAKNFLLVQVPITVYTCSLGVWLSFIQHQFENTCWHRQENWDFYDAALEGSSLLVLPKPLQWITANIGIHHVHHLSA